VQFNKVLLSSNVIYDIINNVCVALKSLYTGVGYVVKLNMVGREVVQGGGLELR